MAKKQKGDKKKDTLPDVEATFDVQGVLFPLDKDSKQNAEFLQAICLGNIFDLIEAYTSLKNEVDSIRDQLSPVLWERYNPQIFAEVITELTRLKEKTIEALGDLLTPETPEAILPIESLEQVRKKTLLYMEEYNKLIEQKEKDYIIKTDPQTGKKYVLQFKGYPGGNPLQELRKISQSVGTPGQVRIPKDFMQLQSYTKGDTLNFVKDPELREKIENLQSQGKLLAGTLEGLSGGEAYLKSFIIALAQTLNEQSKYYNSEGKLSGVPRDLIPEIFGEDVKIRDEKDSLSLPVEVKKDKGREIVEEKRTFPYIIVSYEDLASKLRGEGKQRGGKDAEQVRNYIDSLSEKQYLYGGKDQKGTSWVYGIKLLSKDITIYRRDRRDPKGELKEVGCLLRLSAQFSDTIRGYTGLRANTIQMIGGGKQKDITMFLLDLLLYVRGTDRGNVWKKKKEDLLSQIATIDKYKTHPKLRGEDFQEAIEKVLKCGLITKYEEEKTPGGETLSVFHFNPHYSKGEEDSPEEQTGE